MNIVQNLQDLANKIHRYFKLWLLMSKNAFMVYILDRFSLLIFLFGKIIRFIMFFLFLYFLVRGTDSLAGYSINQTLFFFLTFNLVDIISQFLFREVYRFRSLIVSGGFDLVLTKPMSALFRSLLGGADLIDLVTIPPLLIALFYVGSLLDPTLINIGFFIILVLNGLLIATAFHIAVLALGIITLEIDHTIMIYRDLTSLGRLPVDIYKEPIRSALTFLIPIGIMITLPAKTFFGMVNYQGVLLSFFAAALLMFGSLKFWYFALKRYSSASS